MSIRFLIKLSFMTCLLIVSNNCLASSTDLIEARNFIGSLHKEVSEVSGQSKEQAYPQLREIVKKNIDIKKIAPLVMGKHWKSAGKEEREAFIKEYSIYLERFCARRLYEVAGNEITIMGNKYLGNGNYSVKARSSSNDGFINIGYKIKKSKEPDYPFRITDVIINNMSLTVNQNTRFDLEIQGKGLKSVIADLEQSNLKHNF